MRASHSLHPPHQAPNLDIPPQANKAPPFTSIVVLRAAKDLDHQELHPDRCFTGGQDDADGARILAAGRRSPYPAARTSARGAGHGKTPHPHPSFRDRVL